MMIRNVAIAIFSAIFALLVLPFPCRADFGEKDIKDRAAAIAALTNGMDWSEGAPFISSLLAAIEKYNDYKVDSNLHAIKKGKIKHGGGKLFYKKRNQLRLEVTSGGSNHGAVVVKQADGAIKGAGGGALKFLKMNLEEDSRMLQLPNGYNVTSGDFQSLLNLVKARLGRGETSKVAGKPISSTLWPHPVKVVEVKRQGLTTDRIIVDTQTRVPVEWDVFNNGEMYSVTLFNNFEPNLGLKDELFQL